jgi:methyl-accepting chemotaxis protein
LPAEAHKPREIKQLINDSAAKIEGGIQLVHESGATLQEIVDSVKKVTDVIAEISEASRGQAEEIEQVNRGVSGLDGLTQQNAALVEEAAAAASSLEEQARQLAEAISIFHMTGRSSPAARPDRRPITRLAVA